MIILFFAFKNEEDKDEEEEKRTAAPTQEDIFGEELDVSSDEEDAVTQVIIYYQFVSDAASIFLEVYSKCYIHLSLHKFPHVIKCFKCQHYKNDKEFVKLTRKP